MVKITGIRFKRAGKIYFFDPGDLDLKVGQKAIVETVRGIEMGDVVISSKMVKEEDVVQPLKKIMRAATEEDMDHARQNAAKEPKALEICHDKVRLHELPMKLVGAEYTFDNSKIIFYFTAEGRVDFRELVKDLASVFKMRIELRQIGVRDEAKLVGGLGPCGLPMCCTTWLGDFDPVSIKMAKEQNLSLNPAKISGICGRLMCCLKYESGIYEDESRAARKAVPLRVMPAELEALPCEDSEVCIGCEEIAVNAGIRPEDEEGILACESEAAVKPEPIIVPAAEEPVKKPFKGKPTSSYDRQVVQEPGPDASGAQIRTPQPEGEGAKLVHSEDRPARTDQRGSDKHRQHQRRDFKPPAKPVRKDWQDFQTRDKQPIADDRAADTKPEAPAKETAVGGNAKFKSRRRRHGHRRPGAQQGQERPPEGK